MSYYEDFEDAPDHLATPAEAVDEWRFNVGAAQPERAWLLHDRDVWVKNPFYSGPPVPHPEDERPDDMEDSCLDDCEPREWEDQYLDSYWEDQCEPPEFFGGE